MLLGISPWDLQVILPSLISELSPHVWLVSSQLPSTHSEMSTCLVNHISSLKLHAGEASQSKQTTIPKKRKWLKQGCEGPGGAVGDHTASRPLMCLENVNDIQEILSEEQIVRYA